MQLANRPDKLIKKLLLDVTEKVGITGKEVDQVSSISSTVLSKLLYIVGHIAIRHMVHMDVYIYKELKRRNTLREMRGKNKHQDTAKDMSINKSRLGNAPTPLNARHNISRKSSANIQEDNGEEALEGAVDDAEAEFVNSALENEVVTGNGLLAKFVYVSMIAWFFFYNNNFIIIITM